MRGQMFASGVTDETPLAMWLDVAYATLVNAPHEILGKVHDQMVLTAARIAPDRSTWGLLPEHQEMSRRVMRQEKAVG